MNVLVVNCGSSSLKFQLINYDNRDVLAKGLCERIGIDGRLVYEPKNGEKEVTEAAMPTHVEAIQMVLDALVNEKSGVIKSLEEVDAIGHRVLHGGMKITNSVIIDDEVIKVIEECADLGPLHNPANLMGINACMKLMPGVPNVAVFDTAFHQTMPPKAYMYGIPKEYQENRRVPWQRLQRSEDHRMPYGKWCFPFRCKERQMCRYLHGPYPARRCDHGNPFRRYRSGFC